MKKELGIFDEMTELKDAFLEKADTFIEKMKFSELKSIKQIKAELKQEKKEGAPIYELAKML